MTGPTAARPRRVAIMQPYLFPYLGYFQLAAAVDEFWLLDTVQFIQQGWMNRNALLANGQRTLFTISVNKRPRLDTIDKKIFTDGAARDCAKLIKTLRLAYAKAEHVSTAVSLVKILKEHICQQSQDADFTTATEMALNSCFETIGLSTPIKRISSLELDDSLTGQNRIIAACQAIGAHDYVNMIGGRDLYSADKFAESGLELFFLQPDLPEYDQGLSSFESGLSILDVLARVAPADILKMLERGQLVRASNCSALTSVGSDIR